MVQTMITLDHLLSRFKKRGDHESQAQRFGEGCSFSLSWLSSSSLFPS